jgi:hypothetical protein
MTPFIWQGTPLKEKVWLEGVPKNTGLGHRL